jgi:Ca-activated chloride channel family protein
MLGLLLLLFQLSDPPQDPYAGHSLEEWCGPIVDYLLSQEEREQARALTDDQARRDFLGRIFARFDPAPESPGNPFIAEHLDRYEYADEHFREGGPGWRSERGRAWIVLGPPAERSRDPMGRDNQYASEEWTYHHVSPRLPPDFTLTFVDVMSRGRYRVVESLDLYATALAADSPIGVYMNTRVDPDATAVYFRLHPEAALAILTNGKALLQVSGGRMGPGVASAARQVVDSFSKYMTLLGDMNLIDRLPREQRQSLRERVRTILGPGNLPTAARFDILPAPDGARLLVTFSVPYDQIGYLREGEDRLASLDIYVAGAGAPFEDRVQFRVGAQAFLGLQGEALIYQAGIKLPPGTHQASLAVRDNLGGRVALRQSTVQVESADGLKLGTPILARSIESVSENQESATPFVLGNLRVVPQTDSRFSSGTELPLYIGLYRPDSASSTALRLSYQLKGEGRAVRRWPGGVVEVGGGTQALTAHLPTQGLPAGPYDLEVVVEDPLLSERESAVISLEITAPELVAQALNPVTSSKLPVGVPAPEPAVDAADAPALAAPALLGPASNWRVVVVDPEPGAALLAQTEARAEIVADGKVAVDRVEFWRDGRMVLADLEAPYTCNLDPPPAGKTSSLEAVAYDSSGASRRESVLLSGRSADAAVEVFLVELEVGLTDDDGLPVLDLGRGEFRLLDNGVEQPFAHFDAAAQQPLDIAFLIDSSGSLEPVLDQVRAAALEFARLLLRPQDRVLLVDFDLAPTVLLDLDQGPTGLETALAGIHAGGGTALYDAVAAVVGRLNSDAAQRRSVVVVFTDGDDRDSQMRLEQLLGFARQRDVMVFAVGFGCSGRQRRALEALCGSTGGRAFLAQDADGIGAAAQAVASDIRGRYRIGYYPAASRRDGRWHRLEVRVARPGLTAHARPGYQAPLD